MNQGRLDADAWCYVKPVVQLIKLVLRFTAHYVQGAEASTFGTVQPTTELKTRPGVSLHDESATMTIRALSLLFALTLGVVRAAPADDEANCDRFQSFLVNGTTTVNQLTSDGNVVPLTVINMTPIFAPCGTDWTIIRETLTVIATECDQIQTRDEPLLTSVGGTPKTTCFVTSTVS